MSRALVALEQLRRLTDGTPEDLAALLVEVVRAQPIAGPWKEVRISLLPTWTREVIVCGARGVQFPATVEAGEAEGTWKASARVHPDSWLAKESRHPTLEEARAACDERLRAAGWLLL